MAISSCSLEREHPDGSPICAPSENSQLALPPGEDEALGLKFDDMASFTEIYRLDPYERVMIVETGLPAGAVGALAERMGVSKKKLARILGFRVARIKRCVREGKRLTSDESDRVLGIARLIGQAQVIVEESGNPEGFDAIAWLVEWLETPQPALGQAPAGFMDTVEGQECVANFQSGAYS